MSDNIVNSIIYNNAPQINCVSYSGRAIKTNSLLKTYLATFPEDINTVLGLVSYLFQKWAIENDIADNDKEQEIKSSLLVDTMDRLITVQEKLKAVCGEYPAQRTKAYTRSRENTKAIVALTEEAVERLQYHPDGGEDMYTCIKYVHMEDKENSAVSYHLLTKCYIRAVRTIAGAYGERYNKLFGDISRDYMAIDNEYKSVYHNTDLLLDMYKRTIWDYPSGKDRARKLLGCDSIDEMLNITDKDDVFFGAEYILRMMFYFDDAIEKLKNYPKHGDDLYRLIRYSTDAFNLNKNVDKLAAGLNMSPSQYRYRYKEAVEALSIILWGYSTREIIKILS